LTIDRRESTHVHQLDNLSREDIVARLAAIRKQYPNAFPEPEMKRVEDATNRTEPVELIEAKFTEKDPLPADRE